MERVSGFIGPLNGVRQAGPFAPNAGSTMSATKQADELADMRARLERIGGSVNALTAVVARLAEIDAEDLRARRAAVDGLTPVAEARVAIWQDVLIALGAQKDDNAQFQAGFVAVVDQLRRALAAPGGDRAP